MRCMNHEVMRSTNKGNKREEQEVQWERCLGRILTVCVPSMHALLFTLLKGPEGEQAQALSGTA